MSLNKHIFCFTLNDIEGECIVLQSSNAIATSSIFHKRQGTLTKAVYTGGGKLGM